MANRSRAAATVGVLFIVATVFFMVGSSVYGPISEAPDYLDRAFPGSTTVVVGVLLELIGILAIPLIAVFLFPVFRRESEGWALGYVVIRVIEAMLLMIVSASTLSMLNLSEAYLAGVAQASGFLAASAAIHALGEWAHLLSVGIVFPFAAIVLYTLLLRMHLVPRWIAHWGLWTGILLLGGTLLDQLGLLAGVPRTSLEVILAGPIAVNEMVLAVWLIAKGFNEPVATVESAAV